MGNDRKSLYCYGLPEREQETVWPHHLALQHGPGFIRWCDGLGSGAQSGAVACRDVRHAEAKFGADAARRAFPAKGVVPGVPAIRLVGVQHDFGRPCTQRCVARVNRFDDGTCDPLKEAGERGDIGRPKDHAKGWFFAHGLTITAGQVSSRVVAITAGPNQTAIFRRGESAETSRRRVAPSPRSLASRRGCPRSRC